MKYLIRSCLIVAIVFLLFYTSATTPVAPSVEAPECPVNTTYRCGPRCPELCHRFGYELYKCPDGCVWGCTCNEGYVLEFRGGSCKLWSDCIR